MKKTTRKIEMLPEYDFSKGARGKYAKQYRQGTNIVILEKDVAAMFPTSQDVNKALRALVPIIRSHEARIPA
jgi:hypothetical protein